MRIKTFIELGWVGSKLVVIHEQGYEYSGPVALAKGDNTAKAAEAQQAAFNSQLMMIFQAQYSKQSQMLEFLKGKMEPMIANPTGYSADALTAMRTTATDNIANQYANATKAVQAKEFAQGGAELPSGVNAQVMGSLALGQAADTASAQNSITMANENVREQNYWNAISTLSGNVVNATNPLGYANAATSGSNAVAGLSQAVTQSQQSGWMGVLGGALGAAGSAFTGAGTKAVCWIAEALWGEADERTFLVRAWLNAEFVKTGIGRVVMALYAKFGQRIAARWTLRELLRPIFNLALVQADAWVGCQ